MDTPASMDMDTTDSASAWTAGLELATMETMASMDSMASTTEPTPDTEDTDFPTMARKSGDDGTWKTQNLNHMFTFQ